MDTKRLFFALWPDAGQRERLGDVVAAELGPVTGRPVPAANWHVTLAFIGSYPAARVPELLARAKDCTVEGFSLPFTDLEFWPKPRLACLVPDVTPPALGSLVIWLNSVLAASGIEPEKRAYRPHLTLVRSARPFTSWRLAQPLTLEWRDFELVESVQRRGKLRYLPVKQEL